MYLCVKGAPLLRSARTERVNWQREEGPSPQQPEAAAPLGGGHGCGLVGGQSARALRSPGVTRLWRLHGASEKAPTKSWTSSRTAVFNKSAASWKKNPTYGPRPCLWKNHSTDVSEGSSFVPPTLLSSLSVSLFALKSYYSKSRN